MRRLAIRIEWLTGICWMWVEDRGDEGGGGGALTSLAAARSLCARRPLEIG